MKNFKLAAIFTTYHPDIDFIKRLNTIKSVVDTIIIVDNTPGGYYFDENFQGFHIIQDGINKGIGAAINLGLSRAVDCGYSIAILFDQDSSPDKQVIKSLVEKLLLLDNNSIIGPNYLDDFKDKITNLQKYHSSSLKQVSCIATSGMCFYLNSDICKNNFSIDYFLDYVDFEWCWRMRRKGFKIYKSLSIYMYHRLGLEQRSIFGIKYHVPAPFRHYYQFRDGLRLISKDYVPLYSKIRFTIILLPKLLLYPLILPNGLQRLKWMLLGIRDVFTKSSGIGSLSSTLN